jgi:transglutaminase-like putative cysteine protease
VSVERFFQFSILGLVASGFLAVAGSGYLDQPTLALTTAGLVLRALLILGVVRFQLSERFLTAATLAYAGFFPLDYAFLSRGFLEATVHLVFFLAVMKILSAKSHRDYLYTSTIAFLELLAAAILSANLNFFICLVVYLFFAMAAFTSSEIRRSMDKQQQVARSGLRRFQPRLAALTVFVTAGILTLTAGLFFMLPRTADAAFRRFISSRIFLPGFSNEVTLGQIGQIKSSSRPVMHVMINRQAPANLKWRGGALSDFDGRRWFNPPSPPHIIRIEDGHVELLDQRQRQGQEPSISYRVDLNTIDSDALFFAGTPVALTDFRHTHILRNANDSYRLGQLPPAGFRYEARSVLENTRVSGRARGIPPEILRKYLQLPPLDRRIAELAWTVAGGLKPDTDRARALEVHLRKSYGYTLDLLSREAPDPLAYFLFQRKKGHCEYFASAMTVMLRTLGIPSRLVNGFQSGTYNPLTELYVMRASDAHSWVEAYLEGRGWTTFDPTPPDPNLRQASLWAKLSLYVDAADTFWQDWVLSYSPGLQMTLAERMERSGRSLGSRWFDRLSWGLVKWKGNLIDWFRRFGVWIVALGAFAAVLSYVGPAAARALGMRLRVWRARRGRARTDDATLLYGRMLELLRRKGYQKPAWFTPGEFARTLPPSDLGTLVTQFTEAYHALRFGGRLDAAPRLSQLLERLEQAR